LLKRLNTRRHFKCISGPRLGLPRISRTEKCPKKSCSTTSEGPCLTENWAVVSYTQRKRIGKKRKKKEWKIK
jgi:hypothetical protein